MIAALSLMRRRADLSIEAFRRHWLDPHGVMTAELPGLRRYVQSHCVEHAVTSGFGRALEVAGFAQLWFDDVEARRIAYTSPRIAACNVDSERFIGAVTRLVTEPVEVIVPPAGSKPVRAFILAIGPRDAAWADATEARVLGLPGVVGYLRHTILEQAAAPNSRVPEFTISVAGVAEVAFDSASDFAAQAGRLAGSGAQAARTVVLAVEDHRFV